MLFKIRHVLNWLSCGPLPKLFPGFQGSLITPYQDLSFAVEMAHKNTQWPQTWLVLMCRRWASYQDKAHRRSSDGVDQSGIWIQSFLESTRVNMHVWTQEISLGWTERFGSYSYLSSILSQGSGLQIPPGSILSLAISALLPVSNFMSSAWTYHRPWVWWCLSNFL